MASDRRVNRVGEKTLGIQIATSGLARLLRTLFGVILGRMRLNFLIAHSLPQLRTAVDGLLQELGQS